MNLATLNSSDILATALNGNHMAALVSLSTALPSGSIVFPVDAGVANVKTQFSAKGYGITDDTTAIQAALKSYPNRERIIYLPNGVYLVSDHLWWLIVLL